MDGVNLLNGNFVIDAFGTRDVMGSEVDYSETTDVNGNSAERIRAEGPIGEGFMLMVESHLLQKYLTKLKLSLK